MRKRFLSTLLALSMVITMISSSIVTVYAEETFTFSGSSQFSVKVLADASAGNITANVLAPRFAFTPESDYAGEAIHYLVLTQEVAVDNSITSNDALNGLIMASQDAATAATDRDGWAAGLEVLAYGSTSNNLTIGSQITATLDSTQIPKAAGDYVILAWEYNKSASAEVCGKTFSLNADGSLPTDPLTSLTAKTTDMTTTFTVPGTKNATGETVPATGEGSAPLLIDPSDYIAEGNNGETVAVEDLQNKQFREVATASGASSATATPTTGVSVIASGDNKGKLQITNQASAGSIYVQVGATANANDSTVVWDTTNTITLTLNKTPAATYLEFDTLPTAPKIPGYKGYTVEPGKTPEITNKTNGTAATANYTVKLMDQYGVQMGSATSTDSYVFTLCAEADGTSFTTAPTGITVAGTTVTAASATGVGTLSVASAAAENESLPQAVYIKATKGSLSAVSGEIQIAKDTLAVASAKVTNTIAIQRKADNTSVTSAAPTLAGLDQYGNAIELGGVTAANFSWTVHKDSADGSAPAGHAVAATGEITVNGKEAGISGDVNGTYYLVAVGKGTPQDGVTIGTDMKIVVPYTVSDGKATSQTGTPGEVTTIGVISSTQLSAVADAIKTELEKVTIHSTTEEDEDITDKGIWTTTTPPTTTFSNYGPNTVTYTWNAAGYAPQNVTVTVNLQKQLIAADFEVKGTTVEKNYDATAALPDDAEIRVKDANRVSDSLAAKVDFSFKISGQYRKSNTDSTADTNVSDDKYFHVNGYVEDTAPTSKYYALPAFGTDFVVGGAKIKKVTPEFTPASMSQTAGSVGQVAFDLNPAKSQTDTNVSVHSTENLSGAVQVEYKISAPKIDLTLDCNCGAGNTLAHSHDCAYVADQTQECDCGAADGIAETVLHKSTCPCYSQGYAEGVKCDCGAGNDAAYATHDATSCQRYGEEADQWFEWDAAVPVAGKTAGELISALTTGSFNVRAYLNTDTDNYKMANAGDAGAEAAAARVYTITINPKSTTTGGGGGGSSSYTVKFDAGKNGKITKGNASTSVSSGSKVAASKVPEVTANEGYKFLGWSLDGKTTVDPTEQKITKSVTFTALYEASEKPTLIKDTHMAYIKGYTDGTFKPGKDITRAEVAAIFSRIIKNEVNEDDTASFPDVKAGEWYAPYVAAMQKYGMLKGYPDGTFRPDAPITREEFTAMATRMDEVVKAGSLPFTDVGANSWAADNIYTAYTAGWITGYEDGTFRPTAKLTRAEAVKIVNAMLERTITAKSIEGKQYQTFADVPATHWAYLDVIEAANQHLFTKENDQEIWK